jgi:AcrR family transcriptional regulator
VQYHFGSREGLVEAVFDARMTPIDQRRALLLAALDAPGGVADLWALTDAIVRPLGEAMLIDHPGWYGRFLREVVRSEPALLLADRPAMASLHRASGLAVAQMHAVPPALRPERMRMAVLAAVSMLADREGALVDGAAVTPEEDPEIYVTHVVDLVHAMVAAPPSPALAALLRTAGSIA